MKTKQPNWRVVVEFSGDSGNNMIVLERDITGVYRPQLSYLEEMVDGTFNLSRIVVEPHTYINGILSDNPFHPEIPAWYADTAKKVFSDFEAGFDGMIKILCNNEDIRQQAQVFSWIVEYHGTYEFDQYPQVLTAKEARKWRANINRRFALTKNK